MGIINLEAEFRMAFLKKGFFKISDHDVWEFIDKNSNINLFF